jgi:23S rRNA (uracil1939-C5)-methyltransferase
LEKARQYIELVVNVEDLRKDTGSVATNPIIQTYVKEKYGFYVHSLYIAQVRDKLGIKLHESANKVAEPKRKVSICPDYKEAAIMDAFHYYGIYRA